MSRYTDGEYIFLYWNDDPEFVCIAGWIPFDRAKEIFAQNEESYRGSLFDLSMYRHAYGRWSFSNCAPDGCTHVLELYDAAGRGRFKVTVADVVRHERGPAE